MDTETGEMIVKRVSVPIGLEELMEGLVKEVLLKKPDDIYQFAAKYFAHLLTIREKVPVSKTKTIRTVQSLKEKPERPPLHTRTSKLSKQFSIRADSPIESPIISHKPKLHNRNELKHNKRRHTGPSTVLPNNQQLTIRRKYARSVSGDTQKPVIESNNNKNKVNTIRERSVESADRNHKTMKQKYENNNNTIKLPILTENITKLVENNNNNNEKDDVIVVKTESTNNTNQNKEQITVSELSNIEIKDADIDVKEENKIVKKRSTKSPKEVPNTLGKDKDTSEEEHSQKDDNKVIATKEEDNLKINGSTHLENNSATIDTKEVIDEDKLRKSEEENNLQKDSSTKVGNQSENLLEITDTSAKENFQKNGNKVLDNDNRGEEINQNNKIIKKESSTLSESGNIPAEDELNNKKTNYLQKSDSYKLAINDNMGIGKKHTLQSGRTFDDEEISRVLLSSISNTENETTSSTVDLNDIEKGMTKRNSAVNEVIETKLVINEVKIEEKETPINIENSKNRKEGKEGKTVRSDATVEDVKKSEGELSDDSLEFVEEKVEAATEKSHNLLVTQISSKENETGKMEDNKIDEITEGNTKPKSISTNVQLIDESIKKQNDKLTEIKTLTKVEQLEEKQDTTTHQLRYENINELSNNKLGKEETETEDVSKIAESKTTLPIDKDKSESAEEKLFRDTMNEDNVSISDQKTDLDVPSLETDNNSLIKSFDIKEIDTNEKFDLKHNFTESPESSADVKTDLKVDSIKEKVATDKRVLNEEKDDTTKKVNDELTRTTSFDSSKLREELKQIEDESKHIKNDELNGDSREKHDEINIVDSNNVGNEKENLNETNNKNIFEKMSTFDVKDSRNNGKSAKNKFEKMSTVDIGFLENIKNEVNSKDVTIKQLEQPGADNLEKSEIDIENSDNKIESTLEERVTKENIRKLQDSVVVNKNIEEEKITSNMDEAKDEGHINKLDNTDDKENENKNMSTEKNIKTIETSINKDKANSLSDKNEDKEITNVEKQMESKANISNNREYADKYEDLKTDDAQSDQEVSIITNKILDEPTDEVTEKTKEILQSDNVDNKNVGETKIMNAKINKNKSIENETINNKQFNSLEVEEIKKETDKSANKVDIDNKARTPKAQENKSEIQKKENEVAEKIEDNNDKNKEHTKQSQSLVSSDKVSEKTEEILQSNKIMDAEINKDKSIENETIINNDKQIKLLEIEEIKNKTNKLVDSVDEDNYEDNNKTTTPKEKESKSEIQKKENEAADKIEENNTKKKEHIIQSDSLVSTKEVSGKTEETLHSNKIDNKNVGETKIMDAAINKNKSFEKETIINNIKQIKSLEIEEIKNETNKSVNNVDSDNFEDNNEKTTPKAQESTSEIHKKENEATDKIEENNAKNKEHIIESNSLISTDNVSGKTEELLQSNIIDNENIGETKIIDAAINKNKSTENETINNKETKSFKIEEMKNKSSNNVDVDNYEDNNKTTTPKAEESKSEIQKKENEATDKMEENNAKNKEHTNQSKLLEPSDKVSEETEETLQSNKIDNENIAETKIIDAEINKNKSNENENINSKQIESTDIKEIKNETDKSANNLDVNNYDNNKTKTLKTQESNLENDKNKDTNKTEENNEKHKDLIDQSKSLELDNKILLSDNKEEKDKYINNTENNLPTKELVSIKDDITDTLTRSKRGVSFEDVPTSSDANIIVNKNTTILGKKDEDSDSKPNSITENHLVDRVAKNYVNYVIENDRFLLTDSDVSAIDEVDLETADNETENSTEPKSDELNIETSDNSNIDSPKNNKESLEFEKDMNLNKNDKDSKEDSSGKNEDIKIAAKLIKQTGLDKSSTEEIDEKVDNKKENNEDIKAVMKSKDQSGLNEGGTEKVDKKGNKNEDIKTLINEIGTKEDHKVENDKGKDISANEMKDDDTDRNVLIKNTAENLINSTLSIAQTGLIEHKVKKFLNEFIDREKGNTPTEAVEQKTEKKSASLLGKENSKSFNKTKSSDNISTRPVNGLKKTTSFDSSKLREELKKIEDESKFTSFKSSFNPFLLHKEIENNTGNNELVITSMNFKKIVDAVLTIQRAWRRFKNKKDTPAEKPLIKSNSEDKGDFLQATQAAVVIQRIWKGFKARKHLKSLKVGDATTSVHQKFNSSTSETKDNLDKTTLESNTENHQSTGDENAAPESEERRLFSAESTGSVNTVIFNDPKEEKTNQFHDHYSSNVNLLLDEILDYPTVEEELLLDNYQSKLLDKISGKEEENRYDDIKAYEKIVSPKRFQDLEQLKDEIHLPLVTKTIQNEKNLTTERKLPRSLSSKLEILEEESSTAEDEADNQETKDDKGDIDKNKDTDKLYTFCSEPTTIPGEKKIDGKPLSDCVETVPSNIVSTNDKKTDIKDSKENASNEESKEINKPFNTREVHETLVIPLPTEVKNKLKNGGKEEKISTEPSLDDISSILSNAGLDSGEIHDTVVVPINEQHNDTGRRQPVSVQLCQTSGQVFLIIVLPPFGPGFDRDAENLMTSPAPATDVTETDRNRNAQVPGKADLRIRADSTNDSDISGSPPESMESEKRRKTDGGNMEAQAATKIQAGFRGYQVRKQLKIKNGSSDMTTSKKPSRSKTGALDSSKNQSEKPEEVVEQSAVKIQAGIRGFLVRRRQKKNGSKQA
ncbi:unnamed protein product [Psylliodes chrysocephalus]|uniref:RIIa domain-containing protein n=1 Tax=Psylliodes chrysocephalus TaxID=3402493 RepID=A0A9P0CN49_9CUCU|nr:unnamed protein product [Psylliodes chrysocephala]